MWQYRQKMKNDVFWDVTPGSPIEFHRRFGETYCLYLQSKLCRLLESCWLLSWLTLRTRNECSEFLRNIGEYLPDYTASLARKCYCALSSQWESKIFRPCPGGCMYVCMYIAGEGPKRPQHRDHLWSIGLPRRLVAGFPPRRPRFDPKSGHGESVVGKVALGRIFAEYFCFLF
jgi:hypothetical protein